MRGRDGAKAQCGLSNPTEEFGGRGGRASRPHGRATTAGGGRDAHPDGSGFPWQGRTGRCWTGMFSALSKIATLQTPVTSDATWLCLLEVFSLLEFLSSGSPHRTLFWDFLHTSGCSSCLAQARPPLPGRAVAFPLFPQPGQGAGSHRVPHGHRRPPATADRGRSCPRKGESWRR